ncbi:MAG: hypothetical protein AAF563_19430 [Pseudomonadota bacterium]
MAGKSNEIWEVGGQAFTLHVKPGDFFVVDENGRLCLQQERTPLAIVSEPVEITRDKGDVVVGVAPREMRQTDRIFEIDPGRMRRPFPAHAAMSRPS